MLLLVAMSILLAAWRWGVAGVSDRRSWTHADLIDLQKALVVSTTEEIAKRYDITAKSLRSTLRRHGISIRHLRRPAPAQHACGGLVARRPVDAPAAVYAAEALAALPDRSCRWPKGDPSQADFEFCGAPRFSVLSPYCTEHHARAYRPAPPLFAPRGEASPQIRCLEPALGR